MKSYGIFLLVFCITSIAVSLTPVEPADRIKDYKPALFSNSYPGFGETEVDTCSVNELEQRLNSYRAVFLETERVGVLLRSRVLKDEPLSGFHLTLLYEKFLDFSRATAEMDEFLQRLNLETPEFEEDFKKELLWTYGQTLLIESVFRVCDLFIGNDELRSMLRKQDGAGANQFVTCLRTFQQILDEDRLKELEAWFAETIRLFNGDRPGLNALEVREFGNYFPMNPLESGVFKTVKAGRSLNSVYRCDRLCYRNDRLHSVTGALVRAAGRILGTPIAFVRWGRGNLYMNVEFENKVAEQLRPLDLLIRKRYSSLTNYIIPGYWNHAAVWLGTREQLLELGVWNEPALEPFREEILNGNSIYEVLYNGLNFTPLGEFLDLDEVAVLRVRSLVENEPETIAAVYHDLAGHRDKKYDYGFDIKSSRQVVCTEIIFLSYGDIAWPSEKRFGRSILSPDHLARFVFYENSPLDFIVYYQSGESGEHQEKTLTDFGGTVDVAIKNPSAADGGSPVFLKSERIRKPVFSLRDGGIWLRWHDVYNEYRPRYFAPPPVSE